MCLGEEHKFIDFKKDIHTQERISFNLLMHLLKKEHREGREAFRKIKSEGWVFMVKLTTVMTSLFWHIPVIRVWFCILLVITWFYRDAKKDCWKLFAENFQKLDSDWKLGKLPNLWVGMHEIELLAKLLLLSVSFFASEATQLHSTCKLYKYCAIPTTTLALQISGISTHNPKCCWLSHHLVPLSPDISSSLPQC